MWPANECCKTSPPSRSLPLWAQQQALKYLRRSFKPSTRQSCFIRRRTISSEMFTPRGSSARRPYAARSASGSSEHWRAVPLTRRRCPNACRCGVDCSALQTTRASVGGATLPARGRGGGVGWDFLRMLVMVLDVTHHWADAGDRASRDSLIGLQRRAFVVRLEADLTEALADAGSEVNENRGRARTFVATRVLPRSTLLSAGPPCRRRTFLL